MSNKVNEYIMEGKIVGSIDSYLVVICMLTVLLPLISGLVCGLLGRFLGRLGVGVISVSSMVLALICSIWVLKEVGVGGEVILVTVSDWIKSGDIEVKWGFIFDTIVVVLIFVVNTVSTMVHIYSLEYMREDPNIVRFMSYLSFFTFFMLMLVSGDNYVQLFLGWEGVGVMSYLLINFWYTREQANKSAMKAMIVNRIGDCGLMLAILFIIYVYKSVDYGVIFGMTGILGESTVYLYGKEIRVADIIGLLLLIAAIGKSAQIGLHTWLPDAMEGPTPVSALIHAATMVTAGVFLLIRSSYLLELTPTILSVITIVGALTAFFAGTIGIVQNDIKKVIAYSTCSQLGYMVMICGMSSYNVALYHLMNHAFYKALLFLGSGVIIHGLADEQDMRKMGGLIKMLPFGYVVMFIGSASLMGIPYLTGFYSKDVILEIGSVIYEIDYIFVYWLSLIAAMFTAWYSVRLIYLTFFSVYNGSKGNLNRVHDSPLLMYIPLFCLAIGGIFVGYYFKDMFLGMGSLFWGNSICCKMGGVDRYLESEFIEGVYKIVPLVFTILGMVLGLVVPRYYNSIILRMYKIKYGYEFFLNKWGFDYIYNNIFVYYFLRYSYDVSLRMFDRGIVELIGPTGFMRFGLGIYRYIINLESGVVTHYLLVVFLILILIIISLSFKIVNIFYIYMCITSFIIYLYKNRK